MKKIFQQEIGKMLELYMDDMILKSSQEELHTHHLQQMFKMVQQYKMRLNLEKCTFEVKAGKLSGFYLIDQGIKVNPNKCEVVI